MPAALVSSPDWPNHWYLTEKAIVATNHPDVFGPVEKLCHAAEFKTHKIIDARASPDGEYLAVYLEPRRYEPGEDLLLMMRRCTGCWKKLWSQHLSCAHDAAGSIIFVRDSLAVRTDSWGPLEVFDNATGAEIETVQFTAAVTVPSTYPLARHYAMAVEGQVVGCSPDGTQLWSVPYTHAGMIILRLSHCGRYYEVDTFNGSSALHDVISGALVATFFIDNAERIVAIDSDRYLCYSCSGFQIYGRSVDDVYSPMLVEGPQNLTSGFDDGHDATVLASYGGSTMLIASGDCLVAVNAAAEVVKFWHVPRCVEVWVSSPSQCASCEHASVCDAVDAIDGDAVDATATAADDDGAVGLVRAVLDGFVAEDARVLALRLRLQ